MPEHIYKVIELAGSSALGVEDAVSKAIAKASKTLKHLQWFQVMETRGHIKGDQVVHWQVTIKVGFTLEDQP